MNSLTTWLVLSGCAAALACDGATNVVQVHPEGGVRDVLSDGRRDAGGTDGSVDQSGISPRCLEVRNELEDIPAWLRNRSLGLDSQGFHLTYFDREFGIVHRTFSRNTGLTITSQSHKSCPAGLNPYACGLEAMAKIPSGDRAIAFRYTESEVLHEEIILINGVTITTWIPPWNSPYRIWGLGWDGEAFTASVLDFTPNWGTARISTSGQIVNNLTMLAPASLAYGYYDVETDSQTGTTVLVGASGPGVVVVGRRGRTENLTSPTTYWRFLGNDPYSPGNEPAVALNGDTALVAWVDGLEGIFVREISLNTGESLHQWRIFTSKNNLFESVAAVFAKDRWVIVGQDRSGLVLAEIKDNQMKQRRLFRHPPGDCEETGNCLSDMDNYWRSRILDVVAAEGAAFVGIVDSSKRRIVGERAIVDYRILSLDDACTYKSLASH